MTNEQDESDKTPKKKVRKRPERYNPEWEYMKATID